MTEAPAWRVIVGDARERLAELEAESVQTCVTSPPYFGLRDYGTGSWVGGEPGCAHAPSGAPHLDHSHGRMLGTRGERGTNGARATPQRATCSRCGAQRVDAQIGLEASPAEYVAELVAVFEAVRRVLRPDGTLWLNLGDSYSGSGPSGASYESATTRRRAEGGRQDGAFTVSRRLAEQGLDYSRKQPVPAPGTKSKDLLMIPATVALALRAAGWYLRQEVVWAKTAPMPESVSDRCTRSHEALYMLAKSARYFYDAEAIAEPSVADHDSGNGYRRPERASHPDPSGETMGERGQTEGWTQRPTRNARDVWTLDADERAELEQLRAWRAEVLEGSRRDVWTLGPEPSDVPHFAVMPSELARRCILAGSRHGDLVLDPFAGVATTGTVALALGRSFVGVELSAKYAAIAEQRLGGVTSPLFAL